MPANTERGEVDVVVNGKTYTLKLSMNASAVLQGRHKKNVSELMLAAANLDVVAIRGIVWMLLQKHHAKAFPDEERVGDLLDDAGGFKFFFDTIAQIGELNSDGADPNPPAQGTGSSESSTSAPDAPA